MRPITSSATRPRRPLAEFAQAPRDRCSTRTSRPRNCRRTAAGATALAAVRGVRGGVRRRPVWLFHHKPGRTDHEVAAIGGGGRKVFAGDAPRERDHLRGVSEAPLPGVLVGSAPGCRSCCSAALSCVVAGPAGLNPFEIVEFEDLRLAPVAHRASGDGAAGHRARRDRRSVAAESASRSPAAGPGRASCTRALIDYLARAPAKLIVYDIDFAEADSASASTFGDCDVVGRRIRRGARRFGAEAPATSSCWPTRTFDGSGGARSALPDAGLPRSTCRGIIERAVVLPPFPPLAPRPRGLGHNLFVLDPDGPMRHIVPFVRSERRGCRRSAWPRRSRRRHPPARCPARRTRSALRRPRDAARRGDASRRPTASLRYLWGLINFRGPALLADLKRRTYPTYSFFDLLYFAGADPREAEADGRSGGLPRQDRVRRRDGRRAVRRLRDAVLATARCPASRSTPRWPTTSCRTASSRPARRRVRVATVVAVGAASSALVATLAAGVVGDGGDDRRSSRAFGWVATRAVRAAATG